ncbi:MAG: type II toxin-antitoxin system HicA family toxin [Chloroflexota bacterium]|nr:type II toxin-antitoxin system HicA family toxin [Chloroflexota bacterium]
MARRRKLLLKALNNPRGLRFGEFTRLIEGFGFTLDRQRGSHRLYVREDVREFVNVQPSTDGKAKPAQVREFLELVQRHALQIEEEDG